MTSSEHLAPEDDPRQGVLVGQTVGYARVSTARQNIDRQRHALREAGAARLFEDVADRGVPLRERPGMAALLAWVRDGDQVLIAAIDRLGRSATEARDLLADLRERGVALRILSLGITIQPDGDDLATRIVLGVMLELAQGEAEWIAARQAEGIDRARARGVYGGRAPALTADAVAELREAVAQGVPVARAARDRGISRTTAYAALRPDYRPR